MMRSDKTLVAIIVALAVLVLVAFVVVFRQSPPAYRGADTPEGAAYDYVLALAQQDLEKAWSLLGEDLPKRPETLDEFVRDVDDQPWVFGTDAASTSIRVLPAEPATSDEASAMASVKVERTVFTDRGLLDSSQFSETSVLRLRQSVDGSWRVIGGDRYLHPCWLGEQDCYRRLEAPEKVDPAP